MYRKSRAASVENLWPDRRPREGKAGSIAATADRNRFNVDDFSE
jgi:hypothetical protein